MYEKVFNLHKSPFGMTPDPAFLMMTASHREALSGLIYAIYRRKGFVVLTGEAGTGKTTLLRALMRGAKSAHFSLILHSTLSLDEFLELVLLDFGIVEVPASKARRIVALQELFAQLHRQGKTPVLIVDEAHNLRPEVLEEVRLLTNFETDERKLLHIVLTGQPELGNLLNRPELRQVKQRIEIRLELKPLSFPEVRKYLRHRWEYAGGLIQNFPFPPETIPLIAEASHGIPRLVNAICDNALLLAYGEEVSSVTPEYIREAVNSLDLSNLRIEPSSETKLVDDDSIRTRLKAVPASGASLPSLERYIPPPKPSLIMRWVRMGQ